jgi:hypothetical protein
MIDWSLVQCADEVRLIDLSEAALPAPNARRDQVIADAGGHNLANGRERRKRWRHPRQLGLVFVSWHTAPLIRPTAKGEAVDYPGDGKCQCRDVRARRAFAPVWTEADC